MLIQYQKKLWVKGAEALWEQKGTSNRKSDPIYSIKQKAHVGQGPTVIGLSGLILNVEPGLVTVKYLENARHGPSELLGLNLLGFSYEGLSQ